MQSILHLVNQSPFNNSTLADCIKYYQKGDAILLLENGVYGSLSSQSLANELKDKTCYALEEDLKARGLQNQQLIQEIKNIDYKYFVELTTKYNMVQSWY